MSLALSEAGAVEALPPGASSCQACHAPGRNEPGLRDLSDLSAEEITAAMTAFRTGQRPGTLMPRLVRGFSEAETRAIASALGRRP